MSNLTWVRSEQKATTLARLCCLIFVLLCAAPTARAQGTASPRGFQPGNSYAISDFETVNTTNGDLMLHFPVASLPAGRGGLNAGINLLYDSRLYDSYVSYYQDNAQIDPITHQPAIVQRNLLSQSSEGGWHYGLGYELRLVDKGAEYSGVSQQYRPHCPDWEAIHIYKLAIKFPDGSVHELRPLGLDLTYPPDSTDGYYTYRPDGWEAYCQLITPGVPGEYEYVLSHRDTGRQMSYFSIDGTFLRLDVERDGNSSWYDNPWTLTLADGRQVVNGNAGQQIKDRNNNVVTLQSFFNYNGTGHVAQQLADQFGRAVTIEYGIAPDEDEIRAQGFGAVLAWRIKWKTIQLNKTYDWRSLDGGSVLNSPNTGTLWTARVVERITLPAQAGGLSYTFGYNAPDYVQNSNAVANGWGELNSITLPSGAKPTYAYQLDGSNNIAWHEVLRNVPTRKDLVHRPEYDLAGPPSNTPCNPGTETCITETTLYSMSVSGGGYYGSGASTITSPDGGVLAEQTGLPDTVEAGRAIWSVRSDGTKVERLWRANVPPGTPTWAQYANPYVKTEYTSIKDALGNYTKTAIKDYKYDKNGNVTEVREYDWVPYADVPRNGRPTGVIPAGFPLKRVTLTDYWTPTPDAADSTTASAAVYHQQTASRLRGTVRSREVRADNGQVAARTELYYDDPGARGNLTEQRSWDSTKGGYSNPLGAGNSVSVTHQYDIYGNPTLTIHANGNKTLLVYGSVGGYTGLYPTETHAAYQSSVELVTTQAYDFNTGLVTQTTDPNLVATSTTYDALGRPTLVQAAAGRPEETRVQTEYSDAERRVIIRKDLNTVGDGKLVSVQHYDQLGRVRLTRQLEDAATQSATAETTGIKVQTRYLYSGQNSYQLVSNPYRAAYVSQATGEQTMGWARTKAENGGRVTEVQTFAGAGLPAPWGTNASGTGAVTTAYDGIYTTVTDQAGKLRRSMVDGLGQLARVDEPDANNSMGATTAPTQPTYYTYDALANLTQVTQGAQTRTFQYSSLARLTTATNPESGTVSHSYDANGNLLTKTDARSITTSYTYDALNRNTTVNYSDTTSNPDISRYYDNTTAGAYGRGRYWYDYYFKDDGRIEHQAADFYDALGRPTVRRQVFYAAGQWYGYQVSRTYDKAGHVSAQTYPSGHTVTYNYDGAGRPGDLDSTHLAFTGNLGDGVGRTYAAGLQYNARNQVELERYGTTTPLYRKLRYNARGQVYDIRLSTGADIGGTYDRGCLQFFYSANMSLGGSGADNNGNLVAQDHWVPGAGMRRDVYGYDALNRLSQVQEYQDGSSFQFQQVYNYDRWGNRTISTATTDGLPEPQYGVDTTKNRLTPAGAGTMSYDAAGNLSYDSYSPLTTWGGRTYDAENRLTRQYNTGGGVVSEYTYDADGHRARRTVGGVVTWQVYGLDGELLAEYAGGAAASAPQKEYGYRGGELLVTAEPSANIKWLVSDHLGTPRMVADLSGSLAGVTRHDYLPFGEELYAGTGGRTQQQGYNGNADDNRKQWAQLERDDETGLDYAQARYYSNVQGRFTSPDEFTGGPVELFYFAEDAAANPTFYADLIIPQSLNKYQYAYNNPLRYNDPNGHCPTCVQVVNQVGPTAEQVARAAVIAAAAAAAAGSGAAQKAWDWLTTPNPNFKMNTHCIAGLDCSAAYKNQYLNKSNDQNGSANQGNPSRDTSNAAGQSPNKNDDDKEPVFGERGTQTTSTTVGSGRGWRVDVENPNPGQRAGQIHYQSGNTKFLYDPKTNSFIGASKSQNKQLLSNPEVQRAIKKGLKVLGESQ